MTTHSTEKGTQTATEGETGDLSVKETRIRDFMASLVVFLVALPLCIGIAVACGVPVERGLITGIVGGAIGIISGAPLLVSGPAASLIVPVFALVAEFGLVALGPVVMLAGVMQFLAGKAKMGQWFRAVAPAVITGMLTGIGVLIIGSQLLVSLDIDPKAGFVDNVSAFPGALAAALTDPTTSIAPLWISVATIVLIVGWTKYRPKRVQIIPGHLVALLSVTIGAYLFAPGARTLDISSNFFAGLGTPKLGDFSLLADWAIVGRAAVFAFVASAATLLTANAIDERQSLHKTDYDKEMRAQGVGNFLAGALGGLPMTGVIVRSSVNVDAGARTKNSTIFHAVWLLAFVSLAPQVLELIPRACLGAILVYVGVKLVDVGAMGRLWTQGRAEFIIFVVTFTGVVFVDLFSGILAGLGAAALKIVWTFARLEIRQEMGPSDSTMHLHLEGSATFLQLPRLARALDEVPTDRELHVHIDRLDHIDHACLQLLGSWSRQREGAGHPGMHVGWEELSERYRNALVGTGPAREPRASASIVNMMWAEWKRVNAGGRAPVIGASESGRALIVSEDATKTPGIDMSRWHNWIQPESIVLDSSATNLDEVLLLAAPRLSALTGVDADEILDALRRSSDAHVPLGGGVSLPHLALDGVQRSQVAVIVTRNELQVAHTQADIFFVLLSPESDPREHLGALAHIGGMCHRAPLLTQLRKAKDTTYASLVLDALGRAAIHGTGNAKPGRSLALVHLDAVAEAKRLQENLQEAFAGVSLLSPDDGPTFELMRKMSGEPQAGALLLASIELHEESLLGVLLDQANKLNDQPAGMVVLRDPNAPLRLVPNGSDAPSSTSDEKAIA